MEQKYDPYLSKSLFIRGMQCHKSLYLHKYHPELKDDLSESQEALFQSGIEVGELAWGLFPDGVLIPYEGLSHDEQVAMTMAEMRKGTGTIYEAAFKYDGIFFKADILNKAGERWDLYEVKSSAGVEDYHIDDVVLQYYVLSATGVPVSGAYLVYVNNQYVRDGEIEVDKLFAIEDLTDAVRQKQDFVKEEIVKIREMLKGDLPTVGIGPYCEKPFLCDFCGHCWQHIPEDSVFRLGGKGIDKFEFYRQGIVRLKDVPLDVLNKGQRKQVEAFLKKKEFIDRDAVREFLDTIWYPLYFLDFETFMAAIPLYNKTRPYQQVPFQYSLHYLSHQGARLEHYEFLSKPNVDPREELIKKLISEIPDNACVLAYHAQFEKDRLRELAEAFPQYGGKIENIINNTVDLEILFRRKNVYHWEMGGSYSQKVILPTLVPELGYKDLEVTDGGMAMQTYFEMCGVQDQTDLEKIRHDLLEYCKRDTLGMVKILERLMEIAQGGGICGDA